VYNGAPLLWEDLAAGSYALVATNAEGCTVSKTLAIAEGDALQMDFGQTSVRLHWGDSVWVEPALNFQPVTAEWTPAEGVLCPTCPATFIAAHTSGIYTLSASDANGCSTSAALSIKVEKGVRVYVPNALHLGGSGQNASLSIFTGPEVVRIQSLQLFDRWGNKIFEQKDLAPNTPCAWDGTFRGSLIPPGVLVWTCALETLDGTVERKSGDVTVLR
jgi:hypothetical protein